MNAKQENQFNMYRATAQILTEHTSVWKVVPSIEKVYEHLQKVIGEISSTHQTQEKSMQGLTQESYDLRQDLIAQALKVSAGLQAYCADVDNRVLLKQIDYPPSQLMQSSSTELLTKARLILSLTQGLETKLTGFLVKAEHLEKLATAIQSYEPTTSIRRSATATGKNATQNMTLLFTQTSQMLKNKLDKFMLPFASEAPDFYQKYLTARTVIAPGRGGKRALDKSEEPKV